MLSFLWTPSQPAVWPWQWSGGDGFLLPAVLVRVSLSQPGCDKTCLYGLAPVGVDNGCLHLGALLGAGVNLTDLLTGKDLKENTAMRNPKELNN